MSEVEKISSAISEDLCRKITASLPEYFGLPECNEQYAIGVRSRQNLAVKRESNYIGLISLDFPYPNNCSIYWMAVLRDFQSQGIGHKLLEAAYGLAKDKGASTMTVETVSPHESDENYLKTYKFYQANDFVPLFNLKPQGYEWNMVYMVRYLK
jgi:GNAT superfamily N-acetyltransferase